MTTQELNALYIAKALVSAGCTLEGAAGVVGNIQAESGIYSNRIQGDMTYPYEKSENYTKAVMNGTYKASTYYNDGVGYGLVQWTYWTRKKALLDYCKSTAQYLGDIEPQTQFLIKELKEDYSQVWYVLTTSSDVTACAESFMLKFERPANQTVSARLFRSGLAKNWYSFIKDNINSSELPVQQTETETSTVPKTEYWSPRTIDKTMSGMDVAVLQAVLMARGYYTAGIDSYFGDTTEEAVLAFQKDNGLVVDGIVGKNTWTALLAI